MPLIDVFSALPTVVVELIWEWQVINMKHAEQPFGMWIDHKMLEYMHMVTCLNPDAPLPSD